MTDSKRCTALAAYDPALGPSLTRHQAEPWLGCLAVLAAAATRGIKPSHARRWLTSRGSSDFKALVARPDQWARLVKTSSSYVKSSRSDAGRRASRIAIGRALVGHLLSASTGPVLVSPRSQPGVRAVAGPVGATALANMGDGEGASGIDAPLLSRAWVGVQLGTQTLQAGTRMKTAVDAGWIRQVGHRKGSAQAYKMRQLGQVARETTYDYSATIDALADGDRTDPLAAALLSVANPVWGYGHALDHRCWLVLVADAADIDPTTTYGLSARTVREVRSRMARAGVVSGPDLTDRLDARLDALAREPGPAGEPSALDQWSAAEDRHRADAAERKAAVLVVRAEKDAQHASARQAKEAALAHRATQAHPGATVPVQTKRVPLPAGFDPTRHGAGLRAKVEAAGWTVRGVALQPADGSAPYAVVERAAAAA